MKSFFKKLSLVLAAAMVITMLPLQSTKAATKVNLGIDATKAAAGETIELEVGATQKIGFYGVTNYNTAGAKTKVWKSDNTSVATVTNAFITAVAPGTANISFSCTNNGIDYTGTVKVVVKATSSVPQTQGNVSAKQTKWDTVEVTFADEEAAKAAKDKIVVERVKTSSKGTFYLNVSAKPTQDKNVCKINPLSDGVTYRITVPGAAKPFVITMSVGAPDFVDISYDTVYMSSETKTDISGNSLSNPLVQPTVNVYDANGVIVQTDAKGFKFSTDKTKNIGNPVFNTTKGTIRFNKLESSCYVKVVYSYKDANGKSVSLDPAETTVSPVTYVAPNLQGFVEKITLVDKNTKPADIVYPSDYNYKAEIAVDQELALAFYFETPEGVKYVPDIVKTTVKTDSFKEAKANGALYNYYVVKDDPTATNISFRDNQNGTVYVRGWNEGSEVLCIYEKAVANKQDPLTDKLVGILNIEVEEEAKVVDLHLSDNTLNGFINTEITADKVGVIKYTLEDQYGKAIAANLEVKATDGKPLAGVTIEPSDDKTKGEIKVNYFTFGKSADGRELEISVKNQKDDFKDYITVTTDEIGNTSPGYQLVVKDRTIKNKDLVNHIGTGLVLSIDVANTFEDNRKDLNAPFYVIGDPDTSIAKAPASVQGALVAVITDEEGNTVTKDISGRKFKLASELNNATSYFASVAAGDAFNLDLFWGVGDAAAMATPVNSETLFTGTYTVTLYKTTNTGLSLIDAVEFTVANGIEKLQKTQNTYKLIQDPDNAKAVKVDKDHTGWNSDTVTSATSTALVEQIVNTLWTWLDKDSDGEYDSEELYQIGNLPGGVTYTDWKFVEGANGEKEIFIKYVTIKYQEATGMPIIEQTIEINKKYTYK